MQLAPLSVSQVYRSVYTNNKPNLSIIMNLNEAARLWSSLNTTG